MSMGWSAYNTPTTPQSPIAVNVHPNRNPMLPSTPSLGSLMASPSPPSMGSPVGASSIAGTPGLAGGLSNIAGALGGMAGGGAPGPSSLPPNAMGAPTSPWPSSTQPSPMGQQGPQSPSGVLGLMSALGLGPNAAQPQGMQGGTQGPALVQKFLGMLHGGGNPWQPQAGQ
jgi:hypothetical protein